jgi:hypothetical protein
MFRHPNIPGALAVVALVASLTSSSYAAGVLAPAGSVGSTQLQHGAATAAKIAAGAAGPKGATGDPGPAREDSYITVGTVGDVGVAANDESTGTIACPAGMRVLSGSPAPSAIGASPPRLTLVASEPNVAGTGWVVTMKAGAVQSAFQVEATCASVD